jgi:hypothetical protein
MQVPKGFYWGRLHVAAKPPLKAIGYRYVDRQAGPSFHCVVELATPQEDAAAIRATAAACNFRGASTFRLGAHEEMFVDTLPPDVAQMMREEFDAGEGPVKTKVMRLTATEIGDLGLPAAPPWISAYL